MWEGGWDSTGKGQVEGKLSLSEVAVHSLLSAGWSGYTELQAVVPARIDIII